MTDWRSTPTANRNERKKARKQKVSKQEIEEFTNAPKVENVRESDQKGRQAVEEYKETSLGALFGMGLMVLTYPYYAKARSEGHGREESWKIAFDKAWPIFCATVQVIGPSCPWPGEELATLAKNLQSPVSKLSDKQMADVITLAQETAKDPRMQKKLVQTAVVIGAVAASEGNVSNEQIEAIATDVAKTGGEIATDRAIQRGDISARDRDEIKRAMHVGQKMYDEGENPMPVEVEA